MIGPVVKFKGDTGVMVIVGNELDTVNLGEVTTAGDLLALSSVAVPAISEIPIVPIPVMPLTVTVLEAVPLPVTETEPFIEPVLIKEIFDDTREMLVAPA